jgi:hypothetical protein
MTTIHNRLPQASAAPKAPRAAASPPPSKEPATQAKPASASSPSAPKALPAQGKAAPNVALIDPEIKTITKNEVTKTVKEDVTKAVVTKASTVAAEKTLNASAQIGEAIALRSSRALGASAPVFGAVLSAASAKGDFERAKLEHKSGNPWAARAFAASSALNGFDASLGVWSAGTALSGVGLPATLAIEAVGWAATGTGLLLGIGGEYLSAKGR